MTYQLKLMGMEVIRMSKVTKWVVTNVNKHGEVIEDLSKYPVPEESQTYINECFQPENMRKDDEPTGYEQIESQQQIRKKDD